MRIRDRPCVAADMHISSIYTSHYIFSHSYRESAKLVNSAKRDNSSSMCASTTEAWKCVPPGNGTVRRDPSLTGTPGYDSKSRSAYEYQQRLQEATTNEKRGSSTVRIKQQRTTGFGERASARSSGTWSASSNGREARFKHSSHQATTSTGFGDEHKHNQRTQGSFKHNEREARFKHSSHQAATDNRVRRTSISTIIGHMVR